MKRDIRTLRRGITRWLIAPLYRYTGLKEAWEGTGYQAWGTFSGWLFLGLTIAWCNLGDCWPPWNADKLEELANIFGASIGITVILTLVLGVLKTMLREVLEDLDKRRAAREEWLTQLKAEAEKRGMEQALEQEYARIVAWAREQGIDPPPPPVSSNGNNTNIETDK